MEALNQAEVTKRLREVLTELDVRQTRLQTIAGLSNISRKFDAKNEKYVWTLKDIKKISEAFNISEQYLISGEGDMLASEEKVVPTKTYDKQKGKPYYNVDFQMGFKLMEDDQTVNPEYMIDFYPYNNCDCWCNARGDSMQPTISNGDVIAIKEVNDPRSCLISGEIYAIVTTNDLRTIKRIKDNGETVTLVPDNKDYPEQTISKEVILKVYRVVGSMKMF